VLDVYPDTAANNQFTKAGVKMAVTSKCSAANPSVANIVKRLTSLFAFVPANNPRKLGVAGYIDTLKRPRIMVQYKAACFPLIDRNPQTFVKIFQRQSLRNLSGDA